MRIDAVDEFNEEGHLIYSGNFIGAYVRGRTRDEALCKFPLEIERYCRWRGLSCDGEYSIVVVQEKHSELQICDADSDILFDSEIAPLSEDEYRELSTLAMRSARDFETLYRSIPEKDIPLTQPRKTFYGTIPASADEMYLHTKNVNDYYFGEIGVSTDNEPDIAACRLRAFNELEQKPDFLQNTVFDGSYGEQWSLRKLCRRFVWHDRIHAKAMFNAALKLFGRENIADPFRFTK